MKNVQLLGTSLKSKVHSERIIFFLTMLITTQIPGFNISRNCNGQLPFPLLYDHNKLASRIRFIMLLLLKTTSVTHTIDL